MYINRCIKGYLDGGGDTRGLRASLVYSCIWYLWTKGLELGLGLSWVGYLDGGGDTRGLRASLVYSCIWYL